MGGEGWWGIWGERRKGGGGAGGERGMSDRCGALDRRRVASLGPVFVGDWRRGQIAGCSVALAMFLLAVVAMGDTYLFDRLGGCSGGRAVGFAR